MAPLDELKILASQIEGAASLAALKPIYDRLDEIARLHAQDFEAQLVVADLREHLVHKGVSLRRAPVFPAHHDGDPDLHAAKSPPLDLKRALVIGAGLGVVGWLILFVTLVQIARNRNITPQTPVSASAPPQAGTVAVDISTTPPGAVIQINNDTKCKSNCRVNLPPGNYQVTAMLDGFDPAATGVTVIPGAPISVSLALQNQAQTVRIFTDLPSGRVQIDDKPAPDLQDGQLVLDRVRNGRHRLVVTGPSGQAAFAFDLSAGKAPTIAAPITANNLIAVLVGSMGSEAHVQSSSPTPLKVSLNGQPQGETGPQGLDLKNVPAGDHQLAIGDGPEQRKMVVSFGPMPVLTAFLKSDINAGTLVVVTGEDDVSVFLNGKEYRRKTKRGQLRIPVLGVVNVRVSKEGFQPEPERSTEVKKGEESRLAFQLRPLPQVASLQVRGAAPGTQVMIDDHAAGRVGPDGALSVSNLNPGERIVELRREGFVNKRLPRNFRAGETTLINGADTVMAAASGTLHLLLTPPEAQVVYRRVEEAQFHSAPGGAILKLDPGNYLFTAKAPNHVERTERVPVVAGETRNVEIALPSEHAATVAPKPSAAGATDWGGWSNEGGSHVRKGGNRVPVRSGALNGTITFTAQLRKGGGIFRGGKLRWFLDDGGKVSQFEIDKKHFYAKDASEEGGAEKLTHEEVDEKKYTVQIDITPTHVVQRLKVGDRWIVLGSQPGRSIANGKFGFVIPGGDEVAVSDFHFTPK